MKDDKPKLVKLLEVALDLHAKQGEILAEMTELLGGGVGIGAKLKRLYASFAQVWSLRYEGQVYVFNYTKDAPQMKRLAKAMAVEEIEARFASYIKADEEFVTRAKHSFPMFVATVNQWAGIPKPGLDPLEADAAETSRKRRELRG